MFRLGIEIPPAAKLLMLQASACPPMRLLVIFVSLRQWICLGVFVGVSTCVHGIPLFARLSFVL